MHKNILTVVGITILFLGTCITPSVAIDTIKPISSGNTLYVGGSGEGNYTKIQYAIDAASDGDIVFIYAYSSPYHEEIVVDKSIFLIGEDKHTTSIKGIIYLYSPNISISYLAFIGINWETYNMVINSANNSISECIFKKGNSGIFFYKKAKNNQLKNLVFEDLESRGIWIYRESANNIISNSIFKNNGKRAIEVDHSENNQFLNNNIYDNGEGFNLYRAHNTRIIGNTFTDNNGTGVLLDDSDDCIIESNSFERNKKGLMVDDSKRTKIFHNNFMNNEPNAEFWHLRKLGLTSWKGNYWSDQSIYLFPKIIMGKFKIVILDGLPNPWTHTIRWINVDWHPAKEPYDIEV